MAKSLVVVESPAKAKTINKYLGRDYKVIASMGHVRDLPKSKLVVDVDAELALGQIADVPHRGDDLVILAEIFVDGLRLCGRFDHHE